MAKLKSFSAGPSPEDRYRKKLPARLKRIRGQGAGAVRKLKEFQKTHGPDAYWMETRTTGPGGEPATKMAWGFIDRDGYVNEKVKFEFDDEDSEDWNNNPAEQPRAGEVWRLANGNMYVITVNHRHRGGAVRGARAYGDPTVPTTGDLYIPPEQSPLDGSLVVHLRDAVISPTGGKYLGKLFKDDRNGLLMLLQKRLTGDIDLDIHKGVLKEYTEGSGRTTRTGAPILYSPIKGTTKLVKRERLPFWFRRAIVSDPVTGKKALIFLGQAVGGTEIGFAPFDPILHNPATAKQIADKIAQIEDSGRWHSISNDFYSMAMGHDHPGMREYYPGWDDDDFRKIYGYFEGEDGLRDLDEARRWQRRRNPTKRKNNPQDENELDRLWEQAYTQDRYLISEYRGAKRYFLPVIDYYGNKKITEFRGKPTPTDGQLYAPPDGWASKFTWELGSKLGNYAQDRRPGPWGGWSGSGEHGGPIKNPKTPEEFREIAQGMGFTVPELEGEMLHRRNKLIEFVDQGGGDMVFYRQEMHKIARFNYLLKQLGYAKKWPANTPDRWKKEDKRMDRADLYDAKVPWRRRNPAKRKSRRRASTSKTFNTHISPDAVYLEAWDHPEIHIYMPGKTRKSRRKRKNPAYKSPDSLPRGTPLFILADKWEGPNPDSEIMETTPTQTLYIVMESFPLELGRSEKIGLGARAIIDIKLFRVGLGKPECITVASNKLKAWGATPSPEIIQMGELALQQLATSDLPWGMPRLQKSSALLYLWTTAEDRFAAYQEKLG